MCLCRDCIKIPKCGGCDHNEETFAVFAVVRGVRSCFILDTALDPGEVGGGGASVSTGVQPSNAQIRLGVSILGQWPNFSTGNFDM